MVKPHHLNDRIHVAIIGGNGFIGRHLITRMSQQPNLRIFSIDSNEHNTFLDLQNPKAIVEQPTMKLGIHDHINTFLSTTSLDYIIYCAGCEGVTDGLGGSYRREVSELSFLCNTLDSLQDMPLEEGDTLPYFMYLSSWSVYGSNRRKCSTEKAPLMANNYIGKLKITGEDLVEKVCKKLKMPFCIIRPTEVYGRHSYKQLGVNNRFWRGFVSYYVDHLINSIINPGKDLMVYSPEMKLDLVNINYVTKTIMYLMANNIVGTYNVSSGRSLSMLDLVDKIKDVLTKEVSATPLPSNKLKIEDMTIDSSKLHSLIPYDLENYNFNEFIKQYIPIRREEIARGMAIEQIMAEKYLFDTTAFGAKEAYLDRQMHRKVDYSKIKKIAGERFDEIRYARFNERAGELLENKDPKLIITDRTRDREMLLEKTGELELMDPIKEIEETHKRHIDNTKAKNTSKKNRKLIKNENS